MKWLSLVLLLMFMSQASAGECGKVWIITFDAELYSPESEASMKAKAFEVRYMSAADLQAISSGMSGSVHGYDPENTRVLVEFDGQRYFIDRFGIMRRGKAFKAIDRKAFEAALTRVCQSA
ncbi:hypothetical protein SFA35_16825 [Pseudomonas sp. HR96]|uniref:hypothetical protein n=1 Tax=Pseudomonas sp. HR96 TaxID=1027966 RepID=UPI002A7553FC|nr:hypothetical protein [Pseudomonas sp. HR96]WPO98303.1 hypothetical protein SFA35_16825 [Pseudomonas sp. HR96]